MATIEEALKYCEPADREKVLRALEENSRLRETLANIALLKNGEGRGAIDAGEALVWARTLAATTVGIQLTGDPVPVVAPFITRAAADISRYLLSGKAENYRVMQLLCAARDAIGLGHSGKSAVEFNEEILRAAQVFRGKHEYEVEAVEDVMIQWWRKIHAS